MKNIESKIQSEIDSLIDYFSKESSENNSKFQPAKEALASRISHTRKRNEIITIMKEYVINLSFLPFILTLIIV